MRFFNFHCQGGPFKGITDKKRWRNTDKCGDDIYLYFCFSKKQNHYFPPPPFELEILGKPWVPIKRTTQWWVAVRWERSWLSPAGWVIGHVSYSTMLNIFIQYVDCFIAIYNGPLVQVRKQNKWWSWNRN